MKHLPATKRDAGWFRPVPTRGQPPASSRAPNLTQGPTIPIHQQDLKKAITRAQCVAPGVTSTPAGLNGKKTTRKPEFAVEPCCRGWGRGQIHALIAPCHSQYRLQKATHVTYLIIHSRQINLWSYCNPSCKYVFSKPRATPSRAPYQSSSGFVHDPIPTFVCHGLPTSPGTKGTRSELSAK